MTLSERYHISSMKDDEIKILEEWVVKEGWNPGLSDFAVARKSDPDCFIALREGSTLVGGGSIMSYDGNYGFMGLFIIREDHRRKGLGKELWYWRRDHLLKRLKPNASIGMDGVFHMVPFYERGGFKPAHRDLRFEGIASGEKFSDIIHFTVRNFDEIDKFDRVYVPAPRSSFLRDWMSQPGSYVVGARDRDRLVGYGIARPCRVGFKIGPLFAETDACAKKILLTLLDFIKGEQVQMDIPEGNTSSIRFVFELGLKETFGCMRLYYRQAPKIQLQHIYAVTSLEFG
ncbi:MAG: GNAT family N-acetyltransferase [Hyphomicrobium sp.]